MVLKQWAAVRTCWDVMRTPPQKLVTLPVRFDVQTNEAMKGNWPSFASFPPKTIVGKSGNLGTCFPPIFGLNLKNNGEDQKSSYKICLDKFRNLFQNSEKILVATKQITIKIKKSLPYFGHKMKFSLQIKRIAKNILKFAKRYNNSTKYWWGPKMFSPSQKLGKNAFTFNKGNKNGTSILFRAKKWDFTTTILEKHSRKSGSQRLNHFFQLCRTQTLRCPPNHRGHPSLPLGSGLFCYSHDLTE